MTSTRQMSLKTSDRTKCVIRALRITGRDTADVELAHVADVPLANATLSPSRFSHPIQDGPSDELGHRDQRPVVMQRKEKSELLSEVKLLARRIPCFLMRRFRFRNCFVFLHLPKYATRKPRKTAFSAGPWLALNQGRSRPQQRCRQTGG